MLLKMGSRLIPVTKLQLWILELGVLQFLKLELILCLFYSNHVSGYLAKTATENIHQLKIGDITFQNPKSIQPKIELEEGNEFLTLNLPVSERVTWEIVLEPIYHEILAPNMVTVHRKHSNSTLMIGHPAIDQLSDHRPFYNDPGKLSGHGCIYRHISNDTLASLDLCRPGEIRGLIIRHDEIYILKPTSVELRNPIDENPSNVALQSHVLYKRDTSLQLDGVKETGFCDSDTQHARFGFMARDEPLLRTDDTPTSRASKGNTDIVVEMAVFVDQKLYENYTTAYGTRATDELRNFVAALFNNIQILFHHPSLGQKVKFRIVRFEIFYNQPYDLRASRHSNGHAQLYLDAFCAYQRSLKPQWDHAFLLTGYDLHRSSKNSISGIAKVSGMCSSWGSCTVAEGHDFVASFIGAHEIGHTLGMQHDEIKRCGSNAIMSGSLGQGKVVWSSCSAYSLRTFLEQLDRKRQNCLREVSYKEALTIDISHLPGQKFSGDRQCALMHGSGYRALDRGGNSMCEMMWCRKSTYGHMITSHPALEGTHCGDASWCMGGKCVTWGVRTKVEPLADALVANSVGSNYRWKPTIVDGQWSSWSSPGCQRCPSCAPLAGGIPVVTTQRSCNNPEPANGGKKCAGPSSRAYICNAVSNCHPESLQTFLDRKCEYYRTSRRDWELTGAGAHLTKQRDRLCKVFCVRTSTSSSRNAYRSFGDNLPDGTSCAPNSYCVNGVCVPRQCSGKVLIFAGDSCASDANICFDGNRYSPVSAGAWSGWSVWSSCRTSCGDGYKTRTRSCFGSASCDGDSKETVSCSSTACPETSNLWSQWGSWGYCSVTCGRGVEARSRTCSNGGCVGEAKETRDCDKGYCAWSAWSSCTVTCGSGTKRRSRNCPGGNCVGSNYEDTQCNLQTCSQDSNPTSTADQFSLWNQWSSCSKTCGAGQRYRSRSCANGLCRWEDLRATESCNAAACATSPFLIPSRPGIWSLWSTWSQCDKTCGTGSMVKSRWCDGPYCPGSEKESMPCGTLPPCSVWTGWSVWSTCSQSCDGGVQSRIRSCTSQSCPGSKIDRQTCNSQLCNQRTNYYYGAWGAWGQCSARCDQIGKRSRSRYCASGNCPAYSQDDRDICYGESCFSGRKRRRR